MAAEYTNSSKQFLEHSNDNSGDDIQMLYMQIKMNLETIRSLANEVNNNMNEVKRNMTVTKKLLEAIKPENE